MAKLIPKISPSEIQNHGERKVAEALVNQLSDRSTVIHSFDWQSPMRSSPLIEGECDLIILDPEHGMLFIEVKGGILGYEPDTEQWLRIFPNGERQKINKDPFAQVRVNMYHIVEYMKKNLKGEIPFTYGYAVAFPDHRFTGRLPASIRRELLLDSSAMDKFQESIKRIFRVFSRSSSRRPTKQAIVAAQNALLPKFEILPILYRTVENQETMLHRITEDQKRILDTLAFQKKAAVQGGAGTGKTLIALSKAQEMAKANLRTLLLCYNRPLKDRLLQVASEEFGDMLTIQNFHGLIHDFCELADIPFTGGEDTLGQEFWNDEAPELLMKACDKLPDEQKFDAVIVDEGQDFRELWWTSLDSVFRNPDDKKCFYVFYDPQQNLYVNDKVQLPDELGNPYFLTVNCRNTANIANYCATLVGKEIKTLQSLPSGVEPKTSQELTVQSAIRKVGKIVRLLCMPSSGGLKMSQVAVLVPGYSRLPWPQKFNTIAATQDFEAWQNNQGVLIASLHRFKGLETDAAIILTKPLPDSQSKLHVENYVACSRAKHILYVVEVDQL